MNTGKKSIQENGNVFSSAIPAPLREDLSKRLLISTNICYYDKCHI